MTMQNFSLSFLMISTISTSSAFANDGFYQGAGATLTPVANSSMRVITEKLEISPLKNPACYSIEIPKSEYDEKGELKDDASGFVGKPTKCPQGEDNFDTLKVRWHAKAIYEVEALSDQTGVQIGFPVPTWGLAMENSDGRVDVSVPGVANFSTSIDDLKIKDVVVKNVPVKTLNGENAKKEKLTPAFVWKSDFKKGKRYQLKTEYDFGVSYSNGMYEGSEYPKESLLWFDRRTQAEAKYGGGAGFLSHRVIYYLQPIRLWGGGLPEYISVRVVAPEWMPIYYLTPANSGLECVDKKALYFRWNKAFPTEDLSISYPVQFYPDRFGKFIYFPIKQQAEYDAWSELIGKQSNLKNPPGRVSQIKMACELEKDLLKNLPKHSAFHSWTKNGVQPKCVERCEF